MKKKKWLEIILLLFFIMFNLVECTDKKTEEKMKVDIFDQREALAIADDYLKNVRSGDMEAANSLCYGELLDGNKIIGVGTSEIISYAPEKIIETSDAAYVIFNVIRSSTSNPKCDLDSFSIKVKKDDEQYKIIDIKAVNKKQVFVKNNDLRLIGEDGGESQLIVKLSNMPKDVYLRENKLMLYKDKVPNDAFGVIALSYKGDKIAISTTAGDRTFIAVAHLEESKSAQGELQGEAEKNDVQQNTEDLSEKSISKKLVPIDIIQGMQIKDCIFSKEESEIVVEFTGGNGEKRLAMYKTDNGEVVPLELEQKFPKEKYNLNFVNLDERAVIINVSPLISNNDTTDEVLGIYKIDIDNMDITKVNKNT